jgi:hypothetical protein
MEIQAAKRSIREVLSPFQGSTSRLSPMFQGFRYAAPPAIYCRPAGAPIRPSPRGCTTRLRLLRSSGAGAALLAGE